MKSIAPTLVALSVAVCGCGSSDDPTAPPRPVKVMQVADAGSLASSSFPGRAVPGQEVNLSFRVAGPLIELAANVGDEVEKGDVVARVDPADYQSALSALEGQLQVAEAAAKRADADYARIEATFLDDPGATSQMARDRARQLRDSSAAAVRGLEATVGGARDRLSYTNLEAPFAGEVSETYVENFETVVPKQPILRIVDSSDIEFIVSLPENLIGYAPYITNVEVTFDALPDVTVSAVVKEVGKEATQATRTFPMTLTMRQVEGAKILPGMAGEALIEADLPQGARALGIQIPATSLFTQDDASKSYVWVIAADDTLERREVETGSPTEFGVRVREGLKGGERIVVAGVGFLSEGQRVSILESSDGAGGS